MKRRHQNATATIYRLVIGEITEAKGGRAHAIFAKIDANAIGDAKDRGQKRMMMMTAAATAAAAEDTLNIPSSPPADNLFLTGWLAGRQQLTFDLYLSHIRYRIFFFVIRKILSLRDQVTERNQRFVFPHQFPARLFFTVVRMEEKLMGMVPYCLCSSIREYYAKLRQLVIGFCHFFPFSQPLSFSLSCIGSFIAPCVLLPIDDDSQICDRQHAPLPFRLAPITKQKLQEFAHI